MESIDTTKTKENTIVSSSDKAGDALDVENKTKGENDGSTINTENTENKITTGTSLENKGGKDPHNKAMTSKGETNVKKELIFESLTKDEDKELKEDEIPGYIKEVRLCVIGNVDSGKSTLVGCLTRGVKDDGRGYARKFIFNYQHESESGRTSSIGEEILGVRDGDIIAANRATDKKNVSWKEVAAKSDHVITFLDLCGHEKYLKTTIYGVTALFPDYACILIGTNMGVQRMTKEHLGIIISLGIPFFIVFTKVDIAPKEVKEKTINTFTSIIKTGLQKTVLAVKNTDEAVVAAEQLTGGNLVPIFQVSTVTGEGLESLKKFLGRINPRHSKNSDSALIKSAKEPTEMLLDHAFNTKVGVIHAGLVTAGKIFTGQKLLIGPNVDGMFKPVVIKEIQFLRVTVNELCCGNSCSVKLKSLEKGFDLSLDNFKKGMVLVAPEMKLEPTLEFEAEAAIVHHSSTIRVGYQSVVHCHVIRQTATIVEMDKEYLRAGDKGIVKFRFIKKPEYMHEGDIILFREGRTRGKGKVTKLFPLDLSKFDKEKKKESMKKEKFMPKKGKAQNENPNQKVKNYKEINEPRGKKKE